MLALIDKCEPHEAHPAYWAPFVVMGGGRIKTGSAGLQAQGGDSFLPAWDVVPAH